ncbi:hypothetical protein, partial [Bacillus pumilus]|uniref:hypothetical protein n=1 Tax=Bacillus pumilus TaxID=1408 RepID=UPI00370445E9
MERIDIGFGIEEVGDIVKGVGLRLIIGVVWMGVSVVIGCVFGLIGVFGIGVVREVVRVYVWFFRGRGLVV